MGCKVDTLVERHGLTVPDGRYESVDEYLVARWTGSDGRSADGYKPLTEWFNKRLLRRLYEKRGRDAVSLHVDREYETITGEETIERDELAADLATDGIDVDAVADEMVSWSTMRHHLKGCLDAEKETRAAQTDWETNTVRMARERAAEKAGSVLSSLTSKGRLADADRAQVDVQVKLSCPDCSVRVPFEDAVERGYVCETHAEAAAEETGTESESGSGSGSVAERVRNRSLAVGVPYVAAKALQTVLVEDPFVVDAVLSL